MPLDGGQFMWEMVDARKQVTRQVLHSKFVIGHTNASCCERCFIVTPLRGGVQTHMCLQELQTLEHLAPQ